MMLAYRIILTPDDNGTFMITSPDFPELTTFSASRDEAAFHATGAVEEVIAARMSELQDIPAPLARAEFAGFTGGFVALPVLSGLKVGLYRALLESQMTRADLARALGWHREQVDRLFRLDHASQISQLEAAFAKLGQDLEIEIRPRTAA